MRAFNFSVDIFGGVIGSWPGVRPPMHGEKKEAQTLAPMVL
jgi:hypothetical protein